MKDKLDEVLATGVEQGAAPGVVAMTFDRDGITYEGAFGERSLGSGVAMTPDTVGGIFSMTKAITGAAAMQLVEQGKLSLDDPASEICPQLADTQVLEGISDAGEPQLRPPATPITLRHLLTHTSGFVYDVWSELFSQYLEATGTPGILELKMASIEVPIVFDPGTQWYYGIGIDWVGQMVEAASGQTLGQYMASNLLEPLGMVDTGFAPTPDMLERAAGMHARLPDGSLAPMELEPPPDPEFEMGGGGLFSTMGDYARFCRMVLNGGELDGTRVMSQETATAMGVNSIGDLRVQMLKTSNPQLSNDAEFFPGLPKSWGLTFQINEEQAPTGRPAGSLSWAGLANSFYWIDLQNGIGGCYLSQILPFADPGSMGLFVDFETAVYDSQ